MDKVRFSPYRRSRRCINADSDQPFDYCLPVWKLKIAGDAGLCERFGLVDDLNRNARERMCLKGTCDRTVSEKKCVKE
jgi:hypothetical protein